MGEERPHNYFNPYIYMHITILWSLSAGYHSRPRSSRFQFIFPRILVAGFTCATE